MIIRFLVTSVFVFMIAAAFFVVAGLSCSDRSKASFEVLKGKAENELVNVAGKGDVALQMYRNRHEQITTNLINIKANIRTIERKLDAPRAENMDPDIADRMQATYLTNLERLRVAESDAEQLLAESAVRYEQLRQKVGLIQEQISLAKSMEQVGINSESGQLTREVNGLVDEMERELDAAEAALEVQMLDLSL